MRGVIFAELSTFVAVAEQRSFTKAAVQLGVALPTVSQTVRSLEERLGVRLLNRTTRSVALTEAGERLLAHMQPVLEEVDQAVEAVNAFRDKPAGMLRLAVARPPAMALIAPLVPLFLSEYPAIQLEITIEDVRVDMVTGRFDAGIRTERRIEKDMITKRFVRPFSLLAVAAPAYLACSPRIKSPKDLHAHNCIRQRQSFDNSIQVWEFEKQGQRVEINVEGSFIVNDLQFALSTTLDGLGIGYFPEPLIANYLADGRLVPVFKDWAGQVSGLFLYYSSRRQIPTPLKVFMDFIETNRSRIGTLPPRP